MRIELLASPGCPNADAARKVVTDCLAALGIDVPIIDRVGQYPSPTVLVDGVDVMRPEAGTPIGDACRLDLPTPQRVLDALRANRPQSVAESADQLPPALRELHRAVLRGFCDKGHVHRDDLYSTAAALGVDLDNALHQLASADLVQTASDGQVEVAYPFSGLPTGHTVHLDSHRSVAAMCAIDALGIPLMTGADVVIDSADPDSGTPVRVQRRGDEWTWQPATAVVVIGRTGCCGTLANTACRSITFHTDSEHAQAHLDNHPDLIGFIVGQADAIALADQVFGSLLASRRTEPTARTNSESTARCPEPKTGGAPIPPGPDAQALSTVEIPTKPPPRIRLRPLRLPQGCACPSKAGAARGRQGL